MLGMTFAGGLLSAEEAARVFLRSGGATIVRLGMEEEETEEVASTLGLLRGGGVGRSSLRCSLATTSFPLPLPASSSLTSFPFPLFAPSFPPLPLSTADLSSPTSTSSAVTVLTSSATLDRLTEISSGGGEGDGAILGGGFLTALGLLTVVPLVEGCGNEGVGKEDWGLGWGKAMGLVGGVKVLGVGKAIGGAVARAGAGKEVAPALEVLRRFGGGTAAAVEGAVRVF